MTRLTRNRSLRIVASVAALMSGGMVLGLLPSCETVLTTFNPCGSIFGFCDPVDVNRLFAEVPDLDHDPSCTIPYYGIDGEDPGDCATQQVYQDESGPRP